MASAGKGLPFIGKLNEFIDRVLHPTVQKVGNSRAAIDVVNRGYYLVNVNVQTVEAGSTDSLLVKTGHAFKVGDSIRLTNTANGINEQEIIIDEIIDANTVKFAGYLSASLVAGDQYFHRRPTAELLASDGTRLASLSFIEEQTPGNDTAVPVRRSYVSDANTHALPVEVMGADGMVLNVTTGDINMQLRHDDRTVNAVNVPGDSIKIGNGSNTTPYFMAIDSSGRASVYDSAANTSLDNIEAYTKKLHDNITLDTDNKPAAGIVAMGSDGTDAFFLLTNSAGKLQTETLASGKYMVADPAVLDGDPHPLRIDVNGNLQTKIINTSITVSQSTASDLKAQITGNTNTGSAVPNDAVMMGVRDNTGKVSHIILDNNGRLQAALNYDTNTGAAGVGTLRTVLADKHSVAATPLAFKESDGTNFATYKTMSATQESIVTPGVVKNVLSFLFGWDNTNAVHKEVAVTGSGEIKVDCEQLPTALGLQTASNSMSICQATDNTFVVSESALSAKYAESTSINTTATAVLSGVTAKKIYIQALDTNTANLRVKITTTGEAATTTSGWQFQPGRSDPFEMGGGSLNCTVSVCSESGTNQGVVIQYA